MSELRRQKLVGMDDLDVAISINSVETNAPIKVNVNIKNGDEWLAGYDLNAVFALGRDVTQVDGT